MARPRSDSAVSDVMGTVILLGVTVTVVVAATMNAQHIFGSEQERQLPRVEMAITLLSDDVTVALLHKGGDEIETSDLAFRVAVNGTEVSVTGADPPDSGIFRLGEEVRLTLAAPVPPEAILEVTVVGVAHGAVAATAAMRNVAATTAVSGHMPLSIFAYFSSGIDTAVVRTSTTLVLYAEVDHPAGRKFIREVVADTRAIEGPGWLNLYDDGTNGDTLAGDRVYTRSFVVPSFIPVGDYRVPVTAYALNGTYAQSVTYVRVVESRTTAPTSEPVKVNTSAIVNASWKISKGEGGGTDYVNIHLKLKTVNEKEIHPTTGKSMYPKYAWLYYRPFKPGDDPYIYKIPAKCFNKDNKTVEWQWSNVNIPNYDKDANILEYYFRIEWSSESGGTPSVATYSIEKNADTVYFHLKPTEGTKFVETSPGDYTRINCP